MKKRQSGGEGAQTIYPLAEIWASFVHYRLESSQMIRKEGIMEGE